MIDGGTFRLPALIGLSRAMDLILTGREIKAKEALEWGLANRVCDTGSGMIIPYKITAWFVTLFNSTYVD